MSYNFFKLGVIYLCAIIIPGPTLALLLKNSVVYSRKSGIYSAIGVVIGIVAQSGLVLICMSYVTEDHLLLRVLRVLCPLFLIYLGIKIFISFTTKECSEKLYQEVNLDFRVSSRNNITFLIEGLILEVSNPIAFTFFTTLFMNIIVTNGAITYVKFLYWVEILILGAIWFIGFTYIASSKLWVKKLRKFNKATLLITSVLFISIGSNHLISLFV
jgi:threonine/homoserine/homoserine lactone efflux protein